MSVTPETDREEVARIVTKYDLVSLAVVDAQHRLIGAITVDDVLDIVGEEASEDIFGIAGVTIFLSLATALLHWLA